MTRAMKETAPGFRITGSKGFHVTFENGWTVSVQFGPGNYCENYSRQIGREEKESGENGSGNAECAVWGPGGAMVDPFGEWGYTVSNRTPPADVLRLLNFAATQPVAASPSSAVGASPENTESRP